MNNLKLKKIIRTILEAESGAARQANKLGLTYGQFGRWLNDKGKVVAKSHGDTLIKVDPVKDDEPVDKKSREDDKLKQMQKYQAAGQKFQAPQKTVHPADVPAKLAPPKVVPGIPDTQPRVRHDKQSGESEWDRLHSKNFPAEEIPVEWYNNFTSDLQDSYGFKPDEISPKVVDILYKNKLNADTAAATYSKIKNDVKNFKKKECRRLSSENVIREQPGEHDHKSIEQLEREIGEIEIKKQYNRGLGNFAEWSERKFALRKKQGGSTGKRPDPMKRSIAPGFKLSQFGETP